jgi:hypothetical protein
VDSQKRRRGGVDRFISRVSFDEGAAAAGYPPLTFAWHDGATIAPDAVRKVLVRLVGLSDQEALECLRKMR